MKLDHEEIKQLDRAAAFHSEAAVLFRKAFEIIQTHWTQHRFVDFTYCEEGEWCSTGALHHADGWDGKDYDRLLLTYAFSAVWDALHKTMGAVVSMYNDSHSHAEVINAWRITGEREGWL